MSHKRVIGKCLNSPDGKHTIEATGEICLIDEDTGFVQEIYKCKWCDLLGQKPTMYHPDFAKKLTKIEGAIIIRNGEEVVPPEVLAKIGKEIRERSK